MASIQVVNSMEKSHKTLTVQRARALTTSALWKTKGGTMRSFHDLEAFQTTYDVSLAVMKRVVPFIPDSESRLREHLAEIVKDIPCMIASEAEGGYFKEGKNPDSLALNFIGEAMVLIKYCRDLHERHINRELCNELIALYEQARDGLRGREEKTGEEEKNETVRN